MQFNDRVVVITGAGSGIGREYALFYGSKGAKVVVNDLGVTVKGEGISSKTADEVVETITKNGGVAVANYDSVTKGEKIIKTALDNFQRVDILINNAGILRDVPFENMQDEDWNAVYKTHLYGTYSVTKAAWLTFRKQGYGRIVNITSGAGLYGQEAQANYSSAKAAIIAFTRTLSLEGRAKNILVNAVAPMASTRMTSSIYHPNMLSKLEPKHIVPLIAYLTHESCTETGSVFEAGGGFIAKLRVQRSLGIAFNDPPTPEDLRDNMKKMCDFTESDYPAPKSFLDKINNAELKEKLLTRKERKVVIPKIEPGAPKLKSDDLFLFFNSYLAFEGEKVVEKVKGAMIIEVLNKRNGNPVKFWTLDLKQGNGKVILGRIKVDVILTISDDDLLLLFGNKLKFMDLFTSGRIKIRGNYDFGIKFTPEYLPLYTPENIAKYSSPKL